MPEKDDAPVAAKQAESPATEFPITAEEFCTRLSVTDRRVELIGAFFHQEQVAGRQRDTHGAFAARFDAFARQPA